MEAIELYYYILSIVKKRKGEEEKTGPYKKTEESATI
jgi:hypothetical protein